MGYAVAESFDPFGYSQMPKSAEYIRQNSDGKGGYYNSEYEKQTAQANNAVAGGVGKPGAMAQPVYQAPQGYQTPAAYEKGTYVAPTYDEQRVRDLAQTSEIGRAHV